MTTQATELWASGSVRGPAKRFWPTSTQTKKFAAAAGAPTLAQLTPVYSDPATSTWKVWTSDNEEQTLTFDATGGTYTLSFDGVATPTLTYANTSGDTATILAALEALPGITPGDVAVTRGTPAGNVTIFTVTFQGAWAALNVPAIAVTEALTGGSTTLVQATTVQGTGSPDIDGFVLEPADGANPCTLHATNETLHVVMMGGELHYSDIPLPAGESQTILDRQLLGLRAKGFTIQAMPNWH